MEKLISFAILSHASFLLLHNGYSGKGEKCQGNNFITRMEQDFKKMLKQRNK